MSPELVFLRFSWSNRFLLCCSVVPDSQGWTSRPDISTIFSSFRNSRLCSKLIPSLLYVEAKCCLQGTEVRALQLPVVGALQNHRTQLKNSTDKVFWTLGRCWCGCCNNMHSHMFWNIFTIMEKFLQNLTRIWEFLLVYNMKQSKIHFTKSSFSSLVPVR